MVSYVQPFPGCEILARNDTIRATERKKIKVDLLKNDYVSSGLPVLQKAGGGAAQVGDVIAQKKTAYGVLKLVLTADGKVEFVPGPAFDALKAGQVFKTKFTYTIADASGQLSTATINLSVKGVNNGPAVTALATSNQGQVIEAVDASSQDIRPITGNFLVRDLDRGDRLVGVINKVDVSYSGGVALPDGVQAALGNPAAFSVEPVTANGRSQVMRWTYDPAALNLDFLKAGETITIAFSVAVSDSRSTGATQVVRFTIVGTNDAPVADDDTFSILEDAPLVLDAASLVGDDTDLDRGEGGTALTITGVNAVNGGTVALVNGQVVFTPVANFNGVATFTYTISDGKGGTDTGTVTVNVAAVNDVAIIGDLPDAGVTEDETDPTLTATGTISVVDPDQGEAAFKTTVGSAEGNLGTFVLQANGQYVYTVDNAATQYLDAGEIRQETFTVTTIDGTSKSVTVTITGVNDDAVVVVTDVMDFETDGFFEFPALASFVESPLQDLPFAIVKSFLIADRVDQTDTDEQDQDEGAVDYVAGSGTITAITSTGGAQPPQGGEVAAFAFDPETGRVTYDRSAFNYLDGDQSVTYTITFQMKSGDDAPQTQTIKVTIEGRNDQASFVVGNPEAVTESDIPAPVAFNIKEYVSIFDADAQDAAAPVKYIAGSGTVVASSIVPPQGTTLTSLISFNAQTGQFSYDRKDFNWLNAGDTVTYTISFEAQSGDDGPVPLSILVTITGEDDTPVANDDAPIAENDALVTPEGAALSINAATLLANDTDADGDALEILSVNNPVNGSVSLTDGKILFTPAPDYYGPASFTYTVKDPSGRTDTATVTINVTPLSDKPVAVNDAASTQEGTSVTVDVLGNDTDADNLAPAAPNAGLTIDPASVLVTSGQGSATVVMVDGKPQIQFTPAGDFYGTATVSYVAVDADGNKSDAATVTVTVANVPDAPVANADAVTTSEDTPIAIDVLANDTDADNLAPAAPNAGLSIKAGSVAVVGGTAVGTATIADGKIVFTPATNYNGQATITYVATDGTSDSNQASVTVTVTPVNDAPDLPNGVLPAQQSPEDQTITVTKATLQAILAGPAFDVDNTNAQLDFVIVVKNAGVLIATIPVDGADPQGFTFTPPADFIGPLTVEVTATDPGGLSDTATFALAITPVNDAPVAVGETIIVVEDSPGFTIDVLANDVAGPANESAQVLTIKSATALNGTVTIVDGKLVYKPNANYNGADTITYVIEDNGTTNGAAAPKTAQATVAVTVSPANDAPVANNDSGSTSEDTAVTFTVGQLLANDSALPDTGEVLSVTGVGGAQNGTVSFDAQTGIVTFTPAANYNGPASFTYTISDGNGGTAQGTVNVAVGPVNDAPTLPNLQALVTALGGAMSPEDRVINVTHNDLVQAIQAANYVFDVDNPLSDLTFTFVVKAGGSTIQTITVPGATLPGFSITPPANLDTELVVTVSVSDGALSSASQDVVVDLTPVNDAPEGSDATIAATEDTAYTFGTADFGFSDPVDAASTGGAHAFKAVTITTVPAGGQLLLAGVAIVAGASVSAQDIADGKLTFQPAANSSASQSFTFQVQDAGGTANGGKDLDPTPNTITINVTAVNDAPVVTNIPNLTVQEDGTLTYSQAQLQALIAQHVQDVDTPVANLTFTLTIDGVVTTFTGGTVPAGGLSFTPAADFFGPVPATLAVSDGTTTVTKTFMVDVTPVNDAPVANTDSATLNEDGGPIAIDVLLNDLVGPANEAGQTLTLGGVSALNGTVTVQSGKLVYTPNANYTGPDTITYTVTDNGTTNGSADPKSAQGTVNVTVNPVNDAPAGADNAVSTSEDTSYTFKTADFPFTDEEGHGLRGIQITSLPNAAKGVLTIDGVAVTAEQVANGLFVTKVQIQAGALAFVPVANTSGVATFGAKVADDGGTANGGVDLDPTASIITVNVTQVNDAPVATGGNATGNEDTVINGQVGGTDIDSPTLTYHLVNPVPDLTLGTDGSYSYTPPANFNGEVKFQYVVRDGSAESIAKEVTITVLPVNDAPSAGNDSGSTSEDTAVTFTVGQLLANDSALPDTGEVLSVTGVGGAQNGTVSFDAQTGIVTFTPAANYNGPASFTYTISDGNGGTAQGTVNVAVGPVNDAPVANNDTATVAEGGTAANINVLGNDTDVDSALTPASITGFSQGANGTVTKNADGTFTYVHNGSETTSDAFTYTITDGEFERTATVNVTVTPVNDAPVAVDDVATTPEDTAVVIDVLGNDFDVDGPSITITAVSVPANQGTVAIVTLNNKQQVKFTPAPDYNGPATISYTISDGMLTDVGQVSVTVTPVDDNAAPDAVDDLVSTSYGTPVQIPVVANDSDADGDPLTITFVGSAANGTVILNADKTITYTPNLNFSGADQFTYTISDGNGGTDSAVVRVNVSAPSAPPATNQGVIVISKSGGTPTQAVFRIADLLAADTVAGNDGLTITAIRAFDAAAQRAPLTTSVNNDGTITLATGTLAAGQGKGYVSFTLSDGSVLVAELVIINGSSNTVNVSSELTGLGLSSTYWASYIDAESGNDTVNGMTVGGSGGYDVFRGGNGTDTLNGNFGNDILQGGDDDDMLDGGAGIDLIDFSDGTAGIVFTLNQGVNGAQNSNGFWTFNSGQNALDSDKYKNMEGVIGTSFNDTLTGSANADVLIGGGGADTISAGTGNDTVIGGAGADSMTGGSDADIFVFHAMSDSSSAARDAIVDFVTGTDKINVSTIDANVSTAGDQAFSFVAAQAAAPGVGQITWITSGSSVIVRANNGSGSTLEFELKNVNALTATDFIL